MNDGKTKGISLRVPLTSRSTVGEISDKLMLLASLFKEQDVLYARTTREEVDKKYIKLGNGMYRNWITFESINEEQKKESIEEELQSLFHDNDGNYFFTEELLQKHLKYQQNNKKHI